MNNIVDVDEILRCVSLMSQLNIIESSIFLYRGNTHTVDVELRYSGNLKINKTELYFKSILYILPSLAQASSST